ncbi:MAG: hypothetical protein [Caudoviricetes sp.]|nr:MAG: hypothetical protein [Caudoviricetes sp.]
MSKIYYTVVEISYEYDDETYSESENGAGTPLLVFSDINNAEALVNKKNREYILSIIDSKDMCCYGYDWADIMDTTVVEELNLPELYDFKKSDFEKLTESEKEMFIEGLSIEFYKVVKVKSGD